MDNKKTLFTAVGVGVGSVALAYLGHSFLGEWINLGANTNNSDLKNNYSSIRINISKDLEINKSYQH